jgi:hemerythrin-like domain-containing protein
MNSADSWLVHEHTLYEDLLSLCLDAVVKEDWGTVEQAFHELVTHLKRHMALEEEVLYPAYESMPGMPQGPTMALRDEHSDVVRLVQELARDIKTMNPEPVLECLVQLETLMVKHHEKEEEIFLPMAGHILHASHDELLRKLDEFDAATIEGRWAI